MTERQTRYFSPYKLMPGETVEYAWRKLREANMPDDFEIEVNPVTKERKRLEELDGEFES